MKCILALASLATLGLVACDTMNGPITSGSFDPLNAPGSQRDPNVIQPPTFSAGQFVRAAMNNTAFFKNRPKGNGDADKLLTRGTSMKVITTSQLRRKCNGSLRQKKLIDNNTLDLIYFSPQI